MPIPQLCFATLSKDGASDVFGCSTSSKHKLVVYYSAPAITLLCVMFTSIFHFYSRAKRHKVWEVKWLLRLWVCNILSSCCDARWDGLPQTWEPGVGQSLRLLWMVVWIDNNQRARLGPARPGLNIWRLLLHGSSRLGDIVELSEEIQRVGFFLFHRLHDSHIYRNLKIKLLMHLFHFLLKSS